MVLWSHIISSINVGKRERFKEFNQPFRMSHVDLANSCVILPKKIQKLNLSYVSLILYLIRLIIFAISFTSIRILQGILALKILSLFTELGLTVRFEHVFAL